MKIKLYYQCHIMNKPRQSITLPKKPSNTRMPFAQRKFNLSLRDIHSEPYLNEVSNIR